MPYKMDVKRNAQAITHCCSAAVVELGMLTKVRLRGARPSSHGNLYISHTKFMINTESHNGDGFGHSRLPGAEYGVRCEQQAMQIGHKLKIKNGDTAPHLHII